MRAALLELDAAGRLQDVDPTVAAFSVIGAIVWLPQWFRPGGRLSSEDVAEEMVQFIANGALRPASARRKSEPASKKPPAAANTLHVRRRLDGRAFPRLNPRRFEICMTAARTFVERGYEATSVNAVAAAAAAAGRPGRVRRGRDRAERALHEAEVRGGEKSIVDSR